MRRHRPCKFAGRSHCAGRRFGCRSTTSRYVYEDQGITRVVLQFDGSNNITHRYLDGPAVDQLLADEDSSNVILWSLTDNIGTVRDLVNNSGTTQNHLKYGAFGNVTAESNSAVDFLMGFAGMDRDEETGISYSWHRSAVNERWLSEDPLGFEAGDANLCRYVSNSPANFTDPDGRQLPKIYKQSKDGVPGFVISIGKKQAWTPLIEINGQQYYKIKDPNTGEWKIVFVGGQPKAPPTKPFKPAPGNLGKLQKQALAALTKQKMAALAAIGDANEAAKAKILSTAEAYQTMIENLAPIGFGENSADFKDWTVGIGLSFGDSEGKGKTNPMDGSSEWEFGLMPKK